MEAAAWLAERVAFASAFDPVPAKERARSVAERGMPAWNSSNTADPVAPVFCEVCSRAIWEFASVFWGVDVEPCWVQAEDWLVR